MSEIEAEVKKWGNSLGIRVPASLAHSQGISPGDKVHVTIEKVAAPNPDFWGIATRFPKTGRPVDYQAWKDAERKKERARDASRVTSLRKGSRAR